MKLSRKVLLVLFLLFIPAAIAELLSGSAPPVEYFNPFGFILMSMLYGCGALLVREAKVGWKLGWIAVAILGAAYGILEEGLCCKSFFDPNWADLGETGDYIRYGNTAWFWTVFLTFYHSFISICVPILLSELVFPDLKDTQVTNRKGLGWTIAGLSLVTLVGFAFFSGTDTPYRPPLVNVLLTIAAIVGLILLANHIGSTTIKLKGFSEISPKFPPTLLGFVCWTVPMLLFFIIPLVVSDSTLGMLILLSVMTLSLLVIGGFFSNPTSDLQKFGFLFGVINFFVLLSFMQETDNANRPDNTAGLSYVGLAAFACMLWLRSVIYNRLNVDAGSHQVASEQA